MPVNGAAIAPQFPAPRDSGGPRAGSGPGSTWPTPVPPRDATGGAPASPPAASPPAASPPAAAPANPPGPPIGRLAADIQAMLIQSQGTATGPASPAGPPAGPDEAEKKLAADIQALMSRMGQRQEPGKMPGAHGGAAGGHRHMGHAGQMGHGGRTHSASSVETASAAAGGGGSGAGRTFSTVLAHDISRAIRAYGGGLAQQAS